MRYIVGPLQRVFVALLGYTMLDPYKGVLVAKLGYTLLDPYKEIFITLSDNTL